MQESPPASLRDCTAAVRLAEKLLVEKNVDLNQLTLVRAEYIPRGAAFVWRLTLKRRDLLPATPEEPIGAGGETFVEVDVGAGQARITGTGE